MESWDLESPGSDEHVITVLHNEKGEWITFAETKLMRSVFDDSNWDVIDKEPQDVRSDKLDITKLSTHYSGKFQLG